MWWKKEKQTEIVNKDFESLLNKIAELKFEVKSVQGELKVLQTNYDDLRGKFNRKLNVIKHDEEEQKPGNPSQSLNKPFSMFT